MKRYLILLPVLAGAFLLVAPPVRAQTDPAPVAADQKADAGKWTAPKKVEWSPADPKPAPEQEGEWLDGVEALQKVPEYSAREARRVKRDTLRADQLDRRAARRAWKEARAAGKPRRMRG